MVPAFNGDEGVISFWGVKMKMNSFPTNCTWFSHKGPQISALEPLIFAKQNFYPAQKEVKT